MSSSPEQSVEELREESERSRDALAATVGELRSRVGETATELKTRVSPAHIRKEINEYVRHESESLVKSLQRKARENPLQAAAVGAAVAYPALGLLRAIPTPLLLIGAGLYLTSRRGQEAVTKVKATFDDAVQQGAERAADMAGAVTSDLQDRIAGARYGAEEIRDSITSTVETVTEKARAAFHDTAGAVTAAAGVAADKTTAAVNNITGAAAETEEALKRRTTAVAASSRKTVVDFVNDNALLVAGIGAAVGAFIAASLPPSEAENRLFGTGSDKLKDKARQAAAQGLEQASGIAAETAGSVATAAMREGLDASGVQRALNTVTDSVRAVVDRGLDTALGPDTKPNHPISERNAT